MPISHTILDGLRKTHGLDSHMVIYIYISLSLCIYIYVYTLLTIHISYAYQLLDKPWTPERRHRTQETFNQQLTHLATRCPMVFESQWEISWKNHNQNWDSGLSPNHGLVSINRLKQIQAPPTKRRSYPMVFREPYGVPFDWRLLSIVGGLGTAVAAARCGSHTLVMSISSVLRPHGRETQLKWVFIEHHRHELVGGFNHLEKYWSMGRIIPYIPIYYGK